MKASLLLLLLPLLSSGLGVGENSVWGDGDSGVGCDPRLQDKYCEAWYGGDYHTACNYCGLGAQCPAGKLSGRVISKQDIR